MEWTFIFLPILFHAIVGVAIAVGMVPNTRDYPYGANRRYTWQRWTGLIAFAFIMYHVFQMHGWFHFQAWHEHVAVPFGGAKFKPFNAASTAGLALQSPLVLIFYVVGVLACVFHFANGLWTMGITWGVWISPAAQARASEGLHDVRRDPRRDQHGRTLWHVPIGPRPGTRKSRRD